MPNPKKICRLSQLTKFRKYLLRLVSGSDVGVDWQSLVPHEAWRNTGLICVFMGMFGKTLYLLVRHSCLPSVPAELEACMTSSYSSSRLQPLPDAVGSNKLAIVQMMKPIHHLKHAHIEPPIGFVLGRTLVLFLPGKSCYSKEHLIYVTIWSCLVQVTYLSIDLSQSSINNWATLAVTMTVLSMLDISDQFGEDSCTKYTEILWSWHGSWEPVGSWWDQKVLC